MGGTSGFGVEEQREGSQLGRCGLRMETQTEVKNLGKVVVSRGGYTVGFSSPAFRLGNYGKGWSICSPGEEGRWKACAE